MKITSATLGDTVPELGTRLLSVDKGFELDYEAGVLIVRKEGLQRVWLFPVSKLVRMDTDRETLETQFPKLKAKPKVEPDKK